MWGHRCVYCLEVVQDDEHEVSLMASICFEPPPLSTSTAPYKGSEGVTVTMH